MRVLERNFAGVPDEEAQRMVCGNAVQFFHLDALPAAEPKVVSEVVHGRS
jgi:hypothetical protein